MIIDGLKLTIIGMAVVISFLLLLILVVNISFRLLAAQSAKELEEIEASVLRKRRKHILAGQGSVLVAVISAALTAHRSRSE